MEQRGSEFVSNQYAVKPTLGALFAGRASVRTRFFLVGNVRRLQVRQVELPISVSQEN